ncbi:predicted protein [Naegleria gruberi]|uniref:M-phase inducer phosphatase n=1 Tax=Naegleria gruberi TaxID=5762 RepID=D2VWL3_NAEGR|nr:uncharacterized protein NAEGRDRAFT_52839 [Naegleria gruberi]EFC38911.1 predicted protein [Naegleria gruberi]|eukprot:XP_002671655.1 predicted protein [Naegleria gruberi strain NEG-M]
MKRGRAEANVTSKIKPRILFGGDNDDNGNDEEILTCNTTTNCKTIKYNTTSTTTTSLHNRQQHKYKRNSVQFQQDQHQYSEYSEYDKENCTSFSPLEKKTKTCHSILLCSPPSNAGDRFKSIIKTNVTPTRVLDFSDDHQFSLDDDCGHSSTPKQQQFSEDNQSDHGFILTPPSSTLSRASSRRISLTPPSTGRLSSGSDSIRRNLDFTLCSSSLASGPSNLDSSFMDDPRQHTLLSPFISQFSITSPKSSMKKNRPTNIQLPKVSPLKQDEDNNDDIDTPLISPLLLTSLDDVFGMEATRKDEESYRDFSEPSRRLARDLNDATCSNSGDEDASPSSINTNIQLRLETIVHPKISGCNSITSKTLLQALRDDNLKNQIRIIDCRFPHEYQGGHIRGALNIWTPDVLLEQFFSEGMNLSNQIIVFHCEYSQARAPKMYRYMREHDRKLHLHEYPILSFPDIYVLEGGYKAFWEEDEENKTFSEPRNYVAMDDQRFADECKISYQQCKNAWRNRKSQKSAFL